MTLNATDVLLIEDNSTYAGLIHEMLAEASLTGSRFPPFRLTRADRLAAGLARLAERQFDVILLDPPYASDIQDALQHVGEIAKPDGVVVLEHARKSESPVAPGRLVRTREVRSGDSALTFYTCQL